jgi:hypothetical protein
MKINSCPECGSKNVATESSEIIEVDGCGEQFMWLLCEDCMLVSMPAKINDCMSEEERNALLIEMVKSWNRYLKC